MWRSALLVWGVCVAVCGSATVDREWLDVIQSVYVGTRGNDTAAADMAKILMSNHAEADAMMEEARKQKAFEFTCPVFTCPGPRPTSVHSLRFCDIEVIGALGDSLTAGFGAKAKTLNDLRTEWRGLSFSVGGDANINSLPNFLRRYNPGLTGYSLGTGKETSPNARFNQAISGALLPSLLKQAQSLVLLMKSSLGSTFAEKWKLVTILIGGNDLCGSCLIDVDVVGIYRLSLRSALDFLRRESPRTLVNLVPILDVSQTFELATISKCSRPLKYSCSCGTSSETAVREKVYSYYKAYLDAASEIALEYDDMTSAEGKRGSERERDEGDRKGGEGGSFSVVLQPFFAYSRIPLQSDGTPDLSVFAVDCFHFSVFGQEMLSVYLWNSMMQKVGEKEVNPTYTSFPTLQCPTEETLIATNVNSREGEASEGKKARRWA